MIHILSANKFKVSLLPHYHTTCVQVDFDIFLLWIFQEAKGQMYRLSKSCGMPEILWIFPGGRIIDNLVGVLIGDCYPEAFIVNV